MQRDRQTEKVSREQGEEVQLLSHPDSYTPQFCLLLPGTSVGLAVWRPHSDIFLFNFYLFFCSHTRFNYDIWGTLEVSLCISEFCEVEIKAFARLGFSE